MLVKLTPQRLKAIYDIEIALIGNGFPAYSFARIYPDEQKLVTEFQAVPPGEPELTDRIRLLLAENGMRMGRVEHEANRGYNQLETLKVNPNYKPVYRKTYWFEWTI